MATFAALSAAFALASSAFHPGGAIPARYTCAGRNVSPPLTWTAPPRGTRSFSVTLVDVDAGFLHWQGFDIPASARSLAAGAHLKLVGLNSYHESGYAGPCPAPGRVHHYVFTLRAVGAGGRVLAEANLKATFKQ